MIPELQKTDICVWHTSRSKLVYRLAGSSAALFPGSVNTTLNRVLRNTQKCVFQTVGRNPKLSIEAALFSLKFIRIVLYCSGRAQT